MDFQLILKIDLKSSIHPCYTYLLSLIGMEIYFCVLEFPEPIKNPFKPNYR